MFNFHNALTAFHNEKVTLPRSLRTEMKKRRNSNRTRLDKGLKENKKSLPFKKVTQGSYVMKTMIRDADNDYDIDDGIYFKKSQLKTQLGIDMSALDVRKMICKILSEDNRFKDSAEVRNHCVRVNYNSGYHVDIPIYKTDEDGSNPQLASSKWMPSNAEDVSSWFDEQNQSNSPDKENGRQLRRTVRLLKKFAKSRDSWKGALPSGFALTILVCEQFHPCLGRDDISLHKTMHKIYQRLCGDLEIRHPTTCSALVNSGSEDAKTKNLRNRISENLNNLQLEDCSKEKVATAWNTVFNTDFFVEYVSHSTLLPEPFDSRPIPRSSLDEPFSSPPIPRSSLDEPFDSRPIPRPLPPEPSYSRPIPRPLPSEPSYSRPIPRPLPPEPFSSPPIPRPLPLHDPFHFLHHLYHPSSSPTIPSIFFTTSPLHDPFHFLRHLKG